jgi:hypothetical protein
MNPVHLIPEIRKRRIITKSSEKRILQQDRSDKKHLSALTGLKNKYLLQLSLRARSDGDCIAWFGICDGCFELCHGGC